MKVLGLDLSLRSTGACILYGDGGRPKCRTFLFAQPKASSVEERTERLCAIAEGIVELFDREKPDLVVIEAPAKDQKYQGAAIGELHGVVRSQLYLAFKIHPIVKESTQLRKAVVGTIGRKFVDYQKRNGKMGRRVDYGKVRGKSGRMKLATIKDIVEVRLRDAGWEFPSQDEMDAYVAARFGWNKLVSECDSDDGERSEPGLA